MCKGDKFSSHSVPGQCASHTPREAAPVYVQPRFQRARAGISTPVARRPHGDVTRTDVTAVHHSARASFRIRIRSVAAHWRERDSMLISEIKPGTITTRDNAKWDRNQLISTSYFTVRISVPTFSKL